jgi:hypothetical protein
MKNFLSASVFFISVLGLFALSSCEKEEGEGGTSSITGKVVVRQYNSNFTTLVEQYYAPDENVYIVYGDDVVYGDKTSTNYDGTFKFDYLREGNYKVFVYSEDSANYPTQKEIPVIREVKITKRNQEVTVNQIVILK